MNDTTVYVVAKYRAHCEECEWYGKYRNHERDALDDAAEHRIEFPNHDTKGH